MHADLHELVDHLTPEQADAVRVVVLHLVRATGESERKEAPPVERARRHADVVDVEGRVRRLSFAGALRTGKGDLAARSEDIIRAELDDAA